MLNENISRLRKAKGLTQVDFAKQLHVTQSAVSHWESGRSVPDTVQLFRIAEYFGITVEALNGVNLEQEKKPEHQRQENAPAEKPKPAEIDLGDAETKIAALDPRAEAKEILEELSDDQYHAALQILKLLNK